MPMDLRFSLPAVGVTAALALLVVARTATSPAPAAGANASASQRADIARRIASREWEWAREVDENFPRDSWSQRDDFHGREYKEAQKLARDRNIGIESVLRTIDDDLHRHPARVPTDPDARAAHAVPCKPRPFYD
jgi:hypothetical protein